MTARRDDLANLPDWPRLLSVEQAAAYCGVSAPTFQGWCTLTPFHVGARRLYDRKKIDDWLDAAGGVPDSPYNDLF